MTVLGMLLVFGCAGLANQGAIKYNNDMATITKEAEALDKEFEGQVKRSQGNRAAQQEAYLKVKPRAADIVRRGRMLTPYNSPEGQALHQEYLKFLDTFEEIMNVDYH